MKMINGNSSTMVKFTCPRVSVVTRSSTNAMTQQKWSIQLIKIAPSFPHCCFLVLNDWKKYLTAFICFRTKRILSSVPESAAISWSASWLSKRWQKTLKKMLMSCPLAIRLCPHLFQAKTKQPDIIKMIVCRNKFHVGSSSRWNLSGDSYSKRPFVGQQVIRYGINYWHVLVYGYRLNSYF